MEHNMRQVIREAHSMRAAYLRDLFARIFGGSTKLSDKAA